MSVQEEEEEGPQIFIARNGSPLRIFLHSSIRQEGARLALAKKIHENGGEVIETEEDSNIIIVSTDRVDLDSFRHAYKTHSNEELAKVWIEPVKFISNCVKNGKCIHRFEQKGMGGVAAGRGGRTEFTGEDDAHLAHYLAVLIPVKDDGGRTGQAIYRALMENANILPEEYHWVNRHTWQSWRERYKTRQRRFDRIIADMAAELDTDPHQRYELSRRATKSVQQPKLFFGSEEDELESEEELEVQGADGRKRHISAPRSDERRTKRLRVDRSPSPYDNLDEAAQSSPKGKGRAISDDESDSDGSLFGSQHGPSDTHHTPPPAAPLPSHHISSPVRDDINPISDPPEYATQPPARTRPSPLPRRRQPARGSRVSAAPATQSRRVNSPQPTPVKAASVVPVEPEAVQAPYRNTRAKSRSVELLVADGNAITRKRRGEGKTKVLEPVEEENRDPDLQDFEPEATVETQEERNVEDLLMAANDQSGISDGGITVEDDAIQMPPPRDTTRRQLARHLTLDTDDGQTDLAFRRADSSLSSVPVRYPSVALANNLKTTQDMLANLGTRRLSRPPGSLTSNAASSPLFTQHSPTDVFLDSRNTKSSTRRSSVRKDSASSAESFPRSGTRANQVKREIQAVEKHTPYTPPPGTRAAREAAQSIRTR